jgi:hypothetical protein
LAVGKGDENHCFSETINQGQGLGFTSLGEALALKIHSVARAGFVRGVGGEEAMHESSFTLFVFIIRSLHRRDEHQSSLMAKSSGRITR